MGFRNGFVMTYEYMRANGEALECGGDAHPVDGNGTRQPLKPQQVNGHERVWSGLLELIIMELSVI